MATTIAAVDTGHLDMVVSNERLSSRISYLMLEELFSSQHDAQLDYFSRKLATCSSDRLIKVYDISLDEAITHAADIAR